MRERRDKTVELDDVDSLLGDEAIEHVTFVETLHDDEPIDRDAGATDQQPFASIYQGQDVEINVRRERPIETQFGATGGLTARQARKVQVGKANRLLELINPIADQKDP